MNNAVGKHQRHLGQQQHGSVLADASSSATLYSVAEQSSVRANKRHVGRRRHKHERLCRNRLLRRDRFHRVLVLVLLLLFIGMLDIISYVVTIATIVFTITISPWQDFHGLL